MGTVTKIEWCHHTFNPWWGCTKVAEGCRNCYAEGLDKWLHNGRHWGPGAERRRTGIAYWCQPSRWNQAAAEAGERRRVFCGSMCDVMDPAAPDGQLERLFELIGETPNLDWLLLSKRPERYAEVFETFGCPDNVWAGASASTQRECDRAADIISGLDEPRVVFLSLEPLIERIRLCREHPLDWVIVGGESGPVARRCDVAWLRQVVNDCCWHGTPCFVKQAGSKAHGCAEFSTRLRDPKGGDPDEWPEDLRVREVPV